VSLLYELLYGVGFLPWDTGDVPVELRSLAEGDVALPPGRALDLGCGTGTHAVYLASHGWHVTAVDNVERALRRARSRAAAQSVTVNWVNADVAGLAQLGLEAGFALVFDRGCYHGLSEHQRDAYAAAVTDLAARGATLLIWAMPSSGKPWEPAGADTSEICARFGDWELSGPDHAAPGVSHRGPERGWHQLARR
jgi:SAM-dependent methyltransferase